MASPRLQRSHSINIVSKGLAAGTARDILFSFEPDFTGG
jgi:hypothetical protein